MSKALQTRNKGGIGCKSPVSAESTQTWIAVTAFLYFLKILIIMLSRNDTGLRQRLEDAWTNSRPQKRKIQNEIEAYFFMKKFWSKYLIDKIEQVYTLFLNENFQILDCRAISTGKPAECKVDTEFLLAYTVLLGTKYVYMAHNHPSGNLEQSENDEDVKNYFTSVLPVLGIKLLDGLIISQYDFTCIAKNEVCA